MPATIFPALFRIALVLPLATTGALTAEAQQLTRPVYHVAENTASEGQSATEQQAVATAPVDVPPMRDVAVTPASGQIDSPFDLTQQPGEHPLMPCLRLAKGALVDMDQRIQDYSATFTKVERLDGQLGDPQKMEIRVRHQPFSVYTRFITPNPGQEALYVENQNDGKLVALGSGWKRRFGKVNLPVDGMMAMNGQRYPITKAGIRNLTAELVMIAEQDVKYAECEVSYGKATIDGRDVTMIRAIHPTPRKNFRYHKAEIFIDNELRIPVAYQAFSWPAVQGGEPILEEKYIYTNIKLNNGFTDKDFSPENPEYFQ
ncbi:DUF1571 domain-containing protein [Botrimarina mediterranea]|uniref:DUF1571 domain-containing protein n=1 Tax=Botrimarina mediterranea TaxID=2528022 RepID=A0A518K666_9BACT|nr:DUF1571 domain-containing protein [Botrimarina mediterranea]QDV73281.1 hypothetical protein Spa11_14770 [Botrimarina mediterranea]QDV77798.1 hypothetical protein K2D_14030 [Planctomycetes bacterium K2D]